MSEPRILVLQPPTEAPEIIITSLDPTTILYRVPSSLAANLSSVTLTCFHQAPSPPTPELPAYTPALPAYTLDAPPSAPVPAPPRRETETKITYIPYLGALLSCPHLSRSRVELNIPAHGDAFTNDLAITPDGKIWKRGPGDGKELVAQPLSFRHAAGGKAEALEVLSGKVEEEWICAVWIAWIWARTRRGDYKADGKKSRRGWKRIANAPMRMVVAGQRADY